MVEIQAIKAAAILFSGPGDFIRLLIPSPKPRSEVRNPCLVEARREKIG